MEYKRIDISLSSKFNSSIREKYLVKIKSKLAELQEETDLVNIKKIILFGSVARDETTASSDIDLCLIVDDEISNRYGRTLRTIVSDDYEYPYIDCVVIKESNFYNNPDDWRLYNDIKRDGVIIYEV